MNKLVVKTGKSVLRRPDGSLIKGKFSIDIQDKDLIYWKQQLKMAGLSLGIDYTLTNIDPPAEEKEPIIKLKNLKV